MGSDIFDPSTTYAVRSEAPHTLGQIMQDHQGFEYMFVRAGQDITHRWWCGVTGTYLCYGLSQDNDYPGRVLGVALQTAVPNGHSFWLCITGRGDVIADSAVQNHDSVHTETDANRGEVDDTGGKQVYGAGFIETRNSAGLVAAQWHRPFVI